MSVQIVYNSIFQIFHNFIHLFLSIVSSICSASKNSTLVKVGKFTKYLNCTIIYPFSTLRIRTLTTFERFFWQHLLLSGSNSSIILWINLYTSCSNISANRCIEINRDEILNFIRNRSLLANSPNYIGLHRNTAYACKLYTLLFIYTYICVHVYMCILLYFYMFIVMYCYDFLDTWRPYVK